MPDAAREPDAPEEGSGGASPRRSSDSARIAWALPEDVRRARAEAKAKQEAGPPPSAPPPAGAAANGGLSWALQPPSASASSQAPAPPAAADAPSPPPAVQAAPPPAAPPPPPPAPEAPPAAEADHWGYATPEEAAAARAAGGDQPAAPAAETAAPSPERTKPLRVHGTPRRTTRRRIPDAAELAKAKLQRRRAGEAPAAPQSAASATSSAFRRQLSSHTKRTTVDALARQGVRDVAVMGLPTLERLVEEAVSAAFERQTIQRGQEERGEITADARREFFELLEKHKQALADKSAEERRRMELDDRVRHLNKQLGQAQASLAEERHRSGPTLAPESIVALEQSFKSLLDRFMAEHRPHVLGGDPQAKEGLEQLEKDLGEVFDRLLDRVKSDSEELLELRIAKLNAALRETEDAMRRLARAKSIDGGIASIFDSVQGLSLDDEFYEKKKGLLSIVFVENLKIQGRDVSNEEQQEADAALAALGPEPPKTASGELDFSAFGFAAPAETNEDATAF